MQSNSNLAPVLARRLTVLGSTGSVGAATLDVVRFARSHYGADAFPVEAITAHRNADRLVRDALELRGDARRHEEEAHVGSHRLLQRRHPDGIVVDLDLQAVDLLLALVHVPVMAVVALDQHPQRGRDHRLRQSAHADQFLPDLLDLFVEMPLHAILLLDAPPLS